MTREETYTKPANAEHDFSEDLTLKSYHRDMNAGVMYPAPAQLHLDNVDVDLTDVDISMADQEMPNDLLDDFLKQVNRQTYKLPAHEPANKTERKINFVEKNKDIAVLAAERFKKQQLLNKKVRPSPSFVKPEVKIKKPIESKTDAKARVSARQDSFVNIVRSTDFLNPQECSIRNVRTRDSYDLGSNSKLNAFESILEDVKVEPVPVAETILDKISSLRRGLVNRKLHLCDYQLVEN
ncbi:hypothetical protein Ciccas_011279 [Cichlidogyrus casuarinus]|uniref:Uncharacterized protein n=1 Tax=Cichlidogyrus casuarinus TaxID=1844966 RepID=A0ABD2PRR9_9PLAT